eukprot:scpid68166/ scgid24475/ 
MAQYLGCLGQMPLNRKHVLDLFTNRSGQPFVCKLNRRHSESTSDVLFTSAADLGLDSFPTLDGMDDYAGLEESKDDAETARTAAAGNDGEEQCRTCNWHMTQNIHLVVEEDALNNTTGDGALAQQAKKEIERVVNSASASRAPPRLGAVSSSVPSSARNGQVMAVIVPGKEDQEIMSKDSSRSVFQTASSVCQDIVADIQSGGETEFIFHEVVVNVERDFNRDEACLNVLQSVLSTFGSPCCSTCTKLVAIRFVFHSCKLIFFLPHGWMTESMTRAIVRISNLDSTYSVYLNLQNSQVQGTLPVSAMQPLVDWLEGNPRISYVQLPKCPNLLLRVVNAALKNGSLKELIMTPTQEPDNQRVLHIILNHYTTSERCVPRLAIPCPTPDVLMVLVLLIRDFQNGLRRLTLFGPPDEVAKDTMSVECAEIAVEMRAMVDRKFVMEFRNP